VLFDGAPLVSWRSAAVSPRLDASLNGPATEDDPPIVDTPRFVSPILDGAAIKLLIIRVSMAQLIAVSFRLICVTFVA
jgi:hypothetical protein